jgi:predicted RNA polymerase sigma factor
MLAEREAEIPIWLELNRSLEDAVQDAYAATLTAWPRDGVPAKSGVSP